MECTSKRAGDSKASRAAACVKSKGLVWFQLRCRFVVRALPKFRGVKTIFEFWERGHPQKSALRPPKRSDAYRLQYKRALFKNDWQERLHIAINQIIQTERYEFDRLTNPQKKKIIQTLFVIGAFSEKNAANYVARILQIGRATIFNYLRELKNAN